MAEQYLVIGAEVKVEEIPDEDTRKILIDEGGFTLIPLELAKRGNRMCNLLKALAEEMGEGLVQIHRSSLRARFIELTDELRGLEKEIKPTKKYTFSITKEDGAEIIITTTGLPSDSVSFLFHKAIEKWGIVLDEGYTWAQTKEEDIDGG